MLFSWTKCLTLSTVHDFDTPSAYIHVASIALLNFYYIMLTFELVSVRDTSFRETVIHAEKATYISFWI
jgi:hypothetical protein